MIGVFGGCGSVVSCLFFNILAALIGIISCCVFCDILAVPGIVSAVVT